jgi:hypothetical protein
MCNPRAPSKHELEEVKMKWDTEHLDYELPGCDHVMIHQYPDGREQCVDCLRIWTDKVMAPVVTANNTPNAYRY